VAAQQRLGVVLDPHGRCFGRAESVDAEQIGESPVVDADGGCPEFRGTSVAVR